MVLLTFFESRKWVQLRLSWMVSRTAHGSSFFATEFIIFAAVFVRSSRESQDQYPSSLDSIWSASSIWVSLAFPFLFFQQSTISLSSIWHRHFGWVLGAVVPSTSFYVLCKEDRSRYPWVSFWSSWLDLTFNSTQINRILFRLRWHENRFWRECPFRSPCWI